ncbi:putative disease resistance protein RGA3 [Fagus crenata]
MKITTLLVLKHNSDGSDPVILAKAMGVRVETRPAKTSSPSALRYLATFSSTSGTKEKEPRYRHMIGRRRRPGFPSKKTMTFPSEEDDDSPFGFESPPSRLQDVQSASLEAKSKKLYLFFWHPYSPVMYSLYKIDLPIHLPPPPTEATQTDQIMNPRSLSPILQLKTGEYPYNMSCVSLGDKLYFLGGKFIIDHPNIDEDVKNKLKNVKRDVFPRDVYIFDLATLEVADKKMYSGTRMNSGKVCPQAFVADEKIYVVGSTIQMNISNSSKMKMKDLDLKSFAYFEVYDPVDDKWTVLRNPPIRNVETRWVGHAVVERKALLVAWQRGKERLYCFDLNKRQWTKCSSLRSYPRDFSGSTEFVDDTLYGCYHNTIAAIAPLAEEEESEEEEEEESEEEEEAEEVQHAGSLFKHHSLHLVSGKMGMDAIFNVPPLLQSNMTLTIHCMVAY